MKNNKLIISSFVILVFAAAIVSFSGCAKKVIPNTEIEATKRNTAIITFLERYRHAVEDRNIALILSFVSERYFDNSGTIEGEDDMDKAGLKEFYNERFSSVQSIRYEVKYRDIHESMGKINVEFTYTSSYQYILEGKKKWENHTADNRIVLEEADGKFLILSGM